MADWKVAHRIYLPAIPPPLSACFTDPGRGKRGRVKTKRYREWIKLCFESFLSRYGDIPGEDVEILAGDVKVTYLFERPDRRKRDLGNLEKAVSDLLTDVFIVDDSQIVHMTLMWNERQSAPLEIIIEARA